MRNPGHYAIKGRGRPQSASDSMLRHQERDERTAIICIHQASRHRGVWSESLQSPHEANRLDTGGN
ncbi:hypothetical protein IG631_19659 [Alternaria alternata]|nr:hypothetical protein IG631_19659 [Alternaria alternata]